MKMVIVILNYRTAELTCGCMASLAATIAEVPGARALVVDNASGDGSAEAIAGAIESNGWSSWASMLLLDHNYGFAGGNNRGIACATDADCILLLNSDTIVRPGALRHCAEVMEADVRIGVMSCLLRNADGSVQNAARKFPTPLRQLVGATGLPWSCPRLFGWADSEDGNWDRAAVKRDVDWVGGAFMLIRRQAVEQCGPLNEGFFFYGEDVEFCHRLRRAGWRCHYDPAVWITHLGGSSSDPTRVASRQRSVYIWRARYLLQRMCWGWAAAAMLRGADIVSYSCRRALMILKGRRGTEDYRCVRDVHRMLLGRLNRETVP